MYFTVLKALGNQCNLLYEVLFFENNRFGSGIGIGGYWWWDGNKPNGTTGIGLAVIGR